MPLIEGKTKIIREGATPGEVIVETKDQLTGGDAAKLETIEGISVFKTTQTCNVFQLLERRGIPTSFISRRSERSFVCHRCEMLPLELVVRRYAWGSFLKREPTIQSTRENPHRFDELRLELYHKHAVVMPPLAAAPMQMDEGAARAEYLHDGVWQDGVFTDPLLRIEDDRWMLYPAKAVSGEAESLMETPALLEPAALSSLKEDIMTPTFRVIEDAWTAIETNDGPVALVDLKIEVGYRETDGKLVVADVIDNDSWRIWPGADPSKQLDKQAFREDHPLSQVAENYEIVAALTHQFS